MRDSNPSSGGGPAAHDDSVHEGPIRTPKQLIAAVVASFVLPIFVIVLLVKYVSTGDKPAAGTAGLGPEAVAQRLQPVGSVRLGAAGGPAVLRTGEQVYTAQCAACHAAGIVGAPKFGDAAGWAARIATGYDSMLASVVKGKGAMGAQGGGAFSDFELGRAVVYMANQAGGKLAEPAPPAEAASAPN